MEDKKLTMLFIYNTNNIKYYYNIAYFFRMFGFVVGKYKPESYSSDLDKIIEDYNSVILLDLPKKLINITTNETDYNNISRKILKELMSKGIIEQKNADIFTDSCKNVLKEEIEQNTQERKFINIQEDISNDKNYIDVVKKILNNLVKQNLIDPKDEVVLLEMYKLYQENDLAIAEYLCEKYDKIKEVCDYGLKKFLDFENILFNLYKEGLRSNFLDHARCYSIYLSQRNYKGSLSDFKIDVSRVWEFLERLCERNKNIISGRKLIGQLYETGGYLRRMRNTYESFLEDNENESYSSDVLLRIGKIFLNDVPMRQTIELFSKAYSLDNDNYDALRLYAYCLEKIDYKNNAFKALEYYENQIETLEKIKNAGHMELDEYKSLLMVYFRCGRILSNHPSGSIDWNTFLPKKDVLFRTDYGKAANCFKKAMNLVSEPEMYNINFFSNTSSEHEKILTYQKQFYNDHNFGGPYYQARINYQECKWKLESLG